MSHRYYDLAFFVALEAFEASAFHLSFELAASELNVTPGEISRQIKVIENELDVPLFSRAASGVVLTSAGKDLYIELESIFSKTSQALTTIKRGSRTLCPD
ncbi:LysR family transcriptional regulator [Mesorhizobium calcicola]|uniref:LysR family transcriptional regulator n=1 Tax=Mesorhizobium calcicola TaxID=1300310 RepID=A0ABW4WHF5_9HYPH